jgi:hypothetical protein
MWCVRVPLQLYERSAKLFTLLDTCWNRIGMPDCMPNCTCQVHNCSDHTMQASALWASSPNPKPFICSQLASPSVNLEYPPFLAPPVVPPSIYNSLAPLPCSGQPVQTSPEDATEPPPPPTTPRSSNQATLAVKSPSGLPASPVTHVALTQEGAPPAQLPPASQGGAPPPHAQTAMFERGAPPPSIVMEAAAPITAAAAGQFHL